MKNKFNKNFNITFAMLLAFILLYSILLVLLIYSKYNIFVVCLSVFFISLGLFTLLIFHKKIFTKVIIDENGFVFSYNNKLLESFKWEEIIDIVKTSYYGNGLVFEFILTNENEKFNNKVKYISYNKKIKLCLLNYCPIEELKEKISKL